MRPLLLLILWGILSAVPVFANEPTPLLADVQPSFQQNETLNTIHLGLGIATVTSGLLTGIFNGTWVDVRVHRTLAYTSAGLAFSTMVFGILAHWGEVGTNAPLGDPKNIHAILGAAGGLMLMAAPFVAPAPAHEFLGVGGELLMGVAVAWKFAY